MFWPGWRGRLCRRSVRSDIELLSTNLFRLRYRHFVDKNENCSFLPSCIMCVSSLNESLPRRPSSIIYLLTRGETFLVQVAYTHSWRYRLLIPAVYPQLVVMRITGLKSRRHGRLPGGAVAGSLVVGWMMTLFLSTMLVPVSGWGTIGHEVVANLAWHRLSNQTRQAIQDILGNDDDTNGTDVAGSPLASVADWADRVRTNNNQIWFFSARWFQRCR
jgi:hypothetical protein